MLPIGSSERGLELDAGESLEQSGTQMPTQVRYSEPRTRRLFSCCFPASHESYKHLTAELDRPAWTDHVRSIVERDTFNFIVAAAVVANCIILGWEADTLAQHEVVPWPLTTHWIQRSLSWLFFVELMLRVVADGFDNFFRGPDMGWHIFDCVLIILQLFNKKYGVLRLVRVVESGYLVNWISCRHKFLRSGQPYGLEQSGDELRKIAKSMTGAGATSLVWNLLFMFLVVYVFGVLVLQVITDGGPVEEGHALPDMFSDLPRAMLTLVGCSLGGYSWDQTMSPLIQSGSYAIIGLGVAYIVCFVGAMLNLFTSLFAHKVEAMSDINDIPTRLNAAGNDLKDVTYRMINVIQELEQPRQARSTTDRSFSGAGSSNPFGMANGHGMVPVPGKTSSIGSSSTSGQESPSTGEHTTLATTIPLNATLNTTFHEGETEAEAGRWEEMGEKPARNCIAEWVNNDKFDLFWGILVVLSCTLVGYETQVIAAEGPDGLSNGIVIVQQAFCVAFVLELILRISANGCKDFFLGSMWRWNIFDTLLVVLQICDVMEDYVTRNGYATQNGVLRLARWGRVGRIARAVGRVGRALAIDHATRIVHFEKELRSIAALTTSSLANIFWVLLLVFLIFYSFGVLLLQKLAVDHDAEYLHRHPELLEIFGSLIRTNLTLFESGYWFGGMMWGEVASELGEVASDAAVFFCVSLGISTLAMANFVSGLLAQRATMLMADKLRLENHVKNLEECLTVHHIDILGRLHALNGTTDEYERQEPLSPTNRTKLKKESGGTSMAESTFLQKVQGMPCDISVAERHIDNAFYNDSMAERTMIVVLDALVHEVGGAIIVVLDDQLAKGRQKHDRLKFSSLDQGKLRKCFKRYGANIHEKQDNALAILSAFRKHTKTDRWEEHLIHELARELGEPADDWDRLPGVLRDLNGSPKDGAIIMSLNGTILGACDRLMQADVSNLRCTKGDGEGAGTRHNAGMGVANWLSQAWRSDPLRNAPGAAFVASDDGSVSVMIPTKEDALPKMLEVRL